MKEATSLGHIPRAGSGALASEQARRSGNQCAPTLSRIVAGSSARMAEAASRAAEVPGRMSGIAINTSARRERIFTPRPSAADTAAQSPGALEMPPADLEARMEQPSGMEVKALLQTDVQGNRLGGKSASEQEGGAGAVALSPFRAFFRLFLTHKAAKTGVS